MIQFKQHIFLPLLSIILFLNSFMAHAFSIAAGLSYEGYTNAKIHPLLLRSDDGSTWSLVKKTGFSADMLGEFKSADCSDNACVAVGIKYASRFDPVEPLFDLSNDRGQRWLRVDLSNFIPSGMLEAAKCEKALCIVSGHRVIDGVHSWPVLIVSHDRGHSWVFKNVFYNIPYTTEYDVTIPSISCTDNTCLAVGKYNKLPLVLRSEDNGDNWSYITLPALPSNETEGRFTSVSCIKDSCIAAGSGSKASPLLAVSQDKGKIWSYVKNINGAPANFKARFNKIHCTDKSCIAIGENVSARFTTLIVVSFDKGQTWSIVQTITGTPTDGALLDMDCTGETCIATGYAQQNQNPLIVISHDNGESWSFVENISPLPLPESEFFSIKCLNSDICVTIGRYWPPKSGWGTPLILTSKDRGASWTAVQQIADLPENTEGSLSSLA